MPCFLPYGGSKAEGIRQCADGEAKGKGGEKALATGKKKKNVASAIMGAGKSEIRSADSRLEILR